MNTTNYNGPETNTCCDARPDRGSTVSERNHKIKKKNPRHFFMVDIETTGTVKGKDEVLEIAVVPIERNAEGFYQLVSHPFQRRIHSERKPETLFAKEHMTDLYAHCNSLHPVKDSKEVVAVELREWLHGRPIETQKSVEPLFFMGWNASNFDLEMLFVEEFLRPSTYELEGDAESRKEVLRGDAHYRVYEQTGAIEFLMDVTGLERKVMLDLALNMVPHYVKLPAKGISHNALDDCYYQINLMNGLLALARSGFKIGFN